MYLPLEVAGAVTVTVGDKVEALVAGPVGLGGVHELDARDLDNLAVLDVLGVVLEGEKDTTAAPAELVAQRVVGVLGGGQAAAEALEGEDLATSLVGTVDEVDGVEVVDAGVEANLVHDGDSGGLGLGVELQHGRRDVRCGDDVLFGLDGGLDDDGVEGVGDQRDGQVVGGDGGLKGGRVVDIEADGLGVGVAGRERLGGLERAAGDGDLDAGLGEDLDGGGGDEAGAEDEDRLRHDGRGWGSASN